MKIIQLTAENVKRLRAVQITPNGNLVPITGKNAQGKSSVLDCICYALGGERAIPEQPIRSGTAKAEIKLDLGDLIVTRTFTHKGSYLKVQSKEGFEWKSPQKMLDQLFGKFSFDPWGFIQISEAKQKEVLLSMVTIPLSVEKLQQISGITLQQNGNDPIATLNGAYKTLYDQRAEHNRSCKRIEAAIASIEIPKGMEETEAMSVSGLFEERRQLEEANRENAGKRAALQDLHQHKDDLEERKAGLEAQKEELIRRLQELDQTIEETAAAIMDTETLIETAEAELASINDHDFSEVDARISKADEINRIAGEVKRRKTLEAELAEEQHGANECTDRLESITAYKAELMAQTNFPVQGLDFCKGTISYNGVPLRQASAAEQLRVSMAIAMALNPKLKVIRIEHGSLLDRDSWKIIEEMAREQDYQVWVEKVADAPGDGIYIYDGRIFSGNGEATAQPQPDSNFQQEEANAEEETSRHLAHQASTSLHGQAPIPF
ncbi:MAG TPA: AAA family ATPase [Syntrophobacteraceae bacterium]|nr:AAA family ATPase [Syntrophobacteraceae bacterium]